MEVTCENPSNLLCGLLNTFEFPACIVDENKNIIMNVHARELFENGLDVKKYVNASIFSYQGLKYQIKKQDLNSGTKSKLIIFEVVDETITKLTESSKKLRQVLSAL
jgi:FKBP-type peptidyl-prolyl cis-trans isomerase (trigger factor)